MKKGGGGGVGDSTLCTYLTTYFCFQDSFRDRREYLQMCREAANKPVAISRLLLQQNSLGYSW